MLFGAKIKDLREHMRMSQREVAAALHINNATYCKIEKGDRRAKREQIIVIADLFEVAENELLSLWVADKVNETIYKNIEVAPIAMCIVDDLLKERGVCQ